MGRVCLWGSRVLSGQVELAGVTALKKLTVVPTDSSTWLPHGQ
jgi:hypothetical protein